MITTVNSFLSEILCIERNAALSRLPFVVSVLKGNSFGTDFSVQRAEARKLEVYNNGLMETIDSGKIYGNLPDNCIAIIKLHDVMSLSDQACGPIGIESLAESIDALKKNPSVSAIIVKGHTPGGEALSAFTLNESIKSAVKVKPVINFIYGMEASAGYIGLSACSAIIAAHSMCQIGSVGTFSSILDFTEQLKREGINLIEVYAEKSSDKNGEYREALAGNIQPLQDRVNAINEKVLSIVTENRPNADKEAWGTGKMFSADEALSNGMIDGIMSLDELIENLNN